MSGGCRDKADRRKKRGTEEAKYKIIALLSSNLHRVARGPRCHLLSFSVSLTSFINNIQNCS